MQDSREKTIIRVSSLGIGANILLAAVKAVIGFFSNSIAIILDSVNNLTDALSSVITIIGTRYASKPADKDHPYGHGRAEYVASTLIGIVILYTGITALIESVKKVMNPSVPEYETAGIAILAGTVFVKIFLGLFFRSAGKKADSDSLVASGTDALFDSIVSFSTVVAAFVFICFGKSIEAFLGIMISLLIIKSGVEILKTTLNKILGERVDAQTIHDLKQTVMSVSPDIAGVYDVFLNNYGIGKYTGSLHIEIPDTYTAKQVDVLARKISETVYKTHGISLSAVGIYSVNTSGDESSKINLEILKVINEYRDVLEIHGFYADVKEKKIRFDIVISFDAKDMRKTYAEVTERIEKMYPDYSVQIQFDSDISG